MTQTQTHSLQILGVGTKLQNNTWTTVKQLKTKKNEMRKKITYLSLVELLLSCLWREVLIQCSTASGNTNSLVVINRSYKAQIPPGSLDTSVSSVEWSFLKGKGPQWFTVRKTIWWTKCDFTCNCKRVTNRLKIPQGLSTLCIVGGVKFPQGEGSTVIHCKKNYMTDEVWFHVQS